jgi:hypothetical protein
VCPLLEHTTKSHQDITEQPSASQIEYLVRQQALLMYPKIDSIQGVTVNYINQRKVTVDVNMATKSSTKSVKQVRQDALELQTSLQELDEIDHAYIYLDLNTLNTNGYMGIQTLMERNNTMMPTSWKKQKQRSWSKLPNQ